MKYLNRLIPILLGMMALTSCADNDPLGFDVTKPTSLANLEYLQQYDLLKNYVDRSSNPNFKLGLGVDAASFEQQSTLYQIAITNFDEVTAGNEMKYASCVSDDGTMDFSTVSTLVSNAQAAGITIYGHTLAWHSQQNNTYLNSLMPVISTAKDNNYLLLHQDVAANAWDGQVYYTMSQPLAQGTEYTFSYRAKASDSFTFQLWAMLESGSDVTINGGTMIGTDWADYSYTFTPTVADMNTMKLVVGTLAGDFCIDDIKLTAAGSSENLIANGDFETDDLSGWTKYSWHSVTYAIAHEEGGGGSGAAGYCMEMFNTSTGTNVWDAQNWYTLSTPLQQGVTYTYTFMAKATSNYAMEFYLKNSSSGNQYYPGAFSELTTSWQKITKTFTPEASGIDQLIFNYGTFEGTIWVDDISLTAEGSTTNLIANSDFENGNIDGWSYWTPGQYQRISEEGQGYSSGSVDIELTPEEKKDTLTWAMDNWITGMMEACGGYVTAWDAVNEAISGVDEDGDGYYDLQSATNGDASTNFYWQDYLGNEDYVPIVTKLAEQRFTEFGGNSADLKLFINDYNLESWWDNNQKLKSLIHWIGVWEAKGARIDGIGTQMHVSLILNEQQQKEQEDAIVNMFQLLAATGKLIKISELDMGIVENAFGTGITTANVTYEQQLKMADFYQFIIQKYFEIIPASQQYGITQWCATDSPSDSSWRAGEPVGLWDVDYSRKPTYGGFANGLAGKQVVEPAAPTPSEDTDTADTME